MNWSEIRAIEILGTRVRCLCDPEKNCIGINEDSIHIYDLKKINYSRNDSHLDSLVELKPII